MTSRNPLREGNVYNGNSINRNYQSTGRVINHREKEAGHLLYAHRKAGQKNEHGYHKQITVGEDGRRGWKSKKLNEDEMILRYNSIGVKQRDNLTGSNPPMEKNIRGMSVLNKEKNNFVRDVSERVKRSPGHRLKNIRLYNEGDPNYEQQEQEQETEQVTEKKGQRSKDKHDLSKSGELIERTKSKNIQIEGYKSDRIKGSDVRQLENKKTSIDQHTLPEEKGKSGKSNTLKHLKRKGTRKKKRDASSKKKTEKEFLDKKILENVIPKKRNHQTSLSTKIDRDSDGIKIKKPSVQDLDDKRTKKKKTRKGSESTSKNIKKKKKDGKIFKKSSKDGVFGSNEIFMNSLLYTDKRGEALMKSENPKIIKKRKTKKKGSSKPVKEDRQKQKSFTKMLIKKNKPTTKDITSKERKRYMSVNTNKNPLLDADLTRDLNPRNTLNPKSKNDRGTSFKSNDIEKTELFSYKFQNENQQRKIIQDNHQKEEMLYKNKKGNSATLYQRNRSSNASSEGEEMNHGLYKNLYSGKNEKNILEFNSKNNKNLGFNSKTSRDKSYPKLNQEEVNLMDEINSADNSEIKSPK